MKPAAAAILAKKRRNKHGNRRVVTAAGESFDSVGEYERWRELTFLAAAGHISQAQHHRKYPLTVGLGSEHPVVLGNYESDFSYYDHRTNKWVVEDVKAWDKKTGKFRTTEMFRWKAKHFEAQYGWPITLVKA